MVLIVGGGSGIGREVALLAAERGAHVVVADRDHEAAKKVAEEAKAIAGKEGGLSVGVDIRRRDVIRQSLRELVAAYGGLDVLINTAALFPSSKDGQISDEQWGVTLDINVTANYLLADEAARILKDQNLDASIVLTSSANAVVPKRGSEAYDVSKAALSHLVRELAISLSPKIRVNGISPATVIKGSTMFPRDRVIMALKKYEIAYRMRPATSNCAPCWPSFTPSALSRIAPSIRKIVRKQSCFWRDQNRLVQPATSFPWTVD